MRCLDADTVLSWADGRLFVRRADETADRDVAWTEGAALAALTLESGDAVHVGRARCGTPEPVGGRVPSHTPRAPSELVETTLSSSWDRHRPVSRTLARGGAGEVVEAAGWLDDHRSAHVARGPEGLALHVQPVEGESMRRGAWPGKLSQTPRRLSPDGTRIGASDARGAPALIDATSRVDGALEAGR